MIEVTDGMKVDLGGNFGEWQIKVFTKEDHFNYSRKRNKIAHFAKHKDIPVTMSSIGNLISDIVIYKQNVKYMDLSDKEFAICIRDGGAGHGVGQEWYKIVKVVPNLHLKECRCFEALTPLERIPRMQY